MNLKQLKKKGAGFLSGVVEMVDARDKIKFMVVVADLGIIANTATAHCDLEAIKNEFGTNFNTLLVTNNATEEISVTLDGRKIAFLKGSGTVLGLDWEDNLLFHDVQITNEDAAASTAANEIRVSVGNTGA